MKPDVLSYRDALLPKKKPGFEAYSVWLVSLSFVLFQFLIQLSAGEIVDGLMRSFTLTAFGGSLLASAYYYMYVPLQTPAGILIDRFGPRKLCSTGALVLMLGCFIVGSAKVIALAFLGRAMMGLGAAFAFVGSLYIVDKWFPRKYFSLFVGITESSALLSLVLLGPLLAALIERTGWRVCMLAAGGISGVLGVLYWFVVRDQPLNRRVPGPRPKRRILPGLRVLVRRRVAWLNGLYSGIMFSSVAVFSTFWGIPFLQHARHLSLSHATFLASMVCLGVGIGAPLLGWLDAHIPVRRYVLSAAALLTTVIFAFVIAMPTMPVTILIILYILLGLCSATYMLSYTIANEIAALRIRSASIGLVNTLSVSCAPIMQPTVGLLLFLLARHDHPTNMNAYTVHEYQLSLLLLPILTAIAAWLAFYLPSRKSL